MIAAIVLLLTFNLLVYYTYYRKSESEERDKHEQLVRIIGVCLLSSSNSQLLLDYRVATLPNSLQSHTTTYNKCLYIKQFLQAQQCEGSFQIFKQSRTTFLINSGSNPAKKGANSSPPISSARVGRISPAFSMSKLSGSARESSSDSSSSSSP